MGHVMEQKDHGSGLEYIIVGDLKIDVNIYMW